MMCLKPIFLKSQGIYVPCGKCYACLSRRRNDWSIRCQEERKNSASCFFLTLTYAEEFLPQGANVSKRDVQLFLKRLRRGIDRTYNCDVRKEDILKLKYVLVSEYGPNGTERPHYHALVFFNKPIYLSQFSVYCEHAWSKGFISVSDISDARIHYVTGYIINKQDTRGRVKPFALYSKGLGIEYTENFSEYHNIENPYYTAQGGYKLALPRYWKNKIYSDEERAVINTWYQVQSEMHPIHYTLEQLQAFEDKKNRIFVKHKKH